MVKYFKTVSASIDKETYNKFKKRCDELGCSPHSALKGFILDQIEQMEEEDKKNVRNNKSGAERGGQKSLKINY